MKKTLKNLFMSVLITVACIALFTNFSWAGFTAVNHHKASKDKDSGNIDPLISLAGGYFSYNYGRLHGNRGHYKYKYKHYDHGNKFSNKHSYYRQRYNSKHLKWNFLWLWSDV